MTRHLLLAALAVLFTWSPLTANDNIQTVQLTVTPAGPPEPLLRYRFSAPARELVDGNAASLYYRALLMLGKIPYEQQNRVEISDLLELPLAEIPVEKAHQYLTIHRRALNEVYRATQRRDAIWDIHLSDTGINTMLPEIQTARQLGRLMALDARLAILSGDYAQASQVIGSMYTMSRHVASSCNLIGLLVGIAIESLASDAVEKWIGQAGSPNAYWALTTVPTSVGDFAAAFEAEIQLIQGTIPHTDLLGKVVLPAQEITRLTAALAEIVHVMNDSSFSKPSSILMVDSENLIEQNRDTAILLPAVLRAYPICKQQLLAAGMDPDLINAMHPLQVVTLRWTQVCYDFIDEMALWADHPPVESRPEIKRIVRQAHDWKHRPEAYLADLLFPGALGGIHDAKLRSDRRLAMLRAIEAIRLYAATHDGHLPAALADITEVPVPLDPVSNRPFAYRIEGNTATLAPADDVISRSVHFEISIRL